MKRPFAAFIVLAAGLCLPAQAQAIKIPGLKIQTYQGSANDVETVEVQRSAHSLTFAPFGGKNNVLVECPQRAMTGNMSIKGLPQGYRLTWPEHGELNFDYIMHRIFLLLTQDTPQIKHLRLTCNGDTPKLEAGAGLKLVETK